jgi:hypothetical protein
LPHSSGFSGGVFLQKNATEPKQDYSSRSDCEAIKSCTGWFSIRPKTNALLK